MSIKITQENYYSDIRLSQSALKDYIKCPNFYKTKHIERAIPSELTDALIVGSAFDVLVTEGRQEYEKTYEVVKRRSSNPEEKKFHLTRLQASQIEAMYNRISNQPLMDMFRPAKTQVILATRWMKGKLDYLQTEGNKAIIADLKTCANLDKFRYQAEDFGYKLQMAFYRYLVKQTHRKVTQFRNFIIAIDKTPQHKFGVFEVSQTDLDEEEQEIKRVIKHLRKNKKFDKSYNNKLCTVCPPEIFCPFSKVNKIWDL